MTKTNASIISFFIIWIVALTSECVGQEFAPAYLYGRDSYRTAQEKFTIKASDQSKKKRFLTCVSLKIVDWQPDVSAKPVFEIFPFANRICVNVTNVGWGDFDGGQLRLSQLNYANRNQTASITDALHQLGLVKSGEQKSLLFGDCSQLGFHLRSPINPRISLSEIDPEWEIVDVQNEFAHQEQLEHSTWIPSDSFRDKLKTTSGTSEGFLGSDRGFIKFVGEIEKGGKKRLIPYYGRRFQTVALSTSQMKIAELLHVNFSGGLSNDWEFHYGNLVDRSLIRGGSVMGGRRQNSRISASFGKPSNGKIVRIPLPRIEIPTNGIDFELHVHCAVPGQFKIQIQNAYVTDNENDPEPIRPPFDWIKSEKQIYEVAMPKNYRLDWNETRKTIINVSKLAPELGRAFEKAALPNQELNNKSVYSGTYSERLAKSTFWCDLLLYEAVIDEDRIELSPNLQKTSKWIIGFLDDLTVESMSQRSGGVYWRDKKGEETLFELEYPEMQIVNRSLPLLMKKSPHAAARIVTKLYELGFARQIAKAVCFESTRRVIQERYGGRLRTVLLSTAKKLKADNGWFIVSDEDVLAAALIDFPQLPEFQEKQKYNSRLLGFCSGITSNQLIKQRSQKVLDEYLSYDHETSVHHKHYHSPKCVELMQGFTACGYKDRLSAIEQVAFVAIARGDIEVLKGCIDYFEQFSTTQLNTTLLNRLKEYPNNSSIRKMATELCKK